METEKKKYKRIMLKLSGEALANDKGFGIDPEVVYRNIVITAFHL